MTVKKRSRAGTTSIILTLLASGAVQQQHAHHSLVASASSRQVPFSKRVAFTRRSTSTHLLNDDDTIDAKRKQSKHSKRRNQHATDADTDTDADLNREKFKLSNDLKKDDHDDDHGAESSTDFERFQNQSSLDQQIHDDYFTSHARKELLQRQRPHTQTSSSSSSSYPQKILNSSAPPLSHSHPQKPNTRLIQIPISLTLQQQQHQYQYQHAQPQRAIPISTFIDTGAQVTVMTFQAAKQAGIAHLIDTRYSGHACGVAGVSCKILGRIPANTVSFVVGIDGNGVGVTATTTSDGDGGNVIDMTPAITVLEDRIMEGDTVDMLLGLDVLEDWQAMVCLRDKVLTVRNGCRGGRNRGFVIPFVKPMSSSGSASASDTFSCDNDHDYDDTFASSPDLDHDLDMDYPHVDHGYRSAVAAFAPAPSSNYRSQSYTSYAHSHQHSHQHYPNPPSWLERTNQDSSSPYNRRTTATTATRNPVLDARCGAMAMQDRGDRSRSSRTRGITEIYMDSFDDDNEDDYSDSYYYENDEDYDCCDLSGV